VKLDVREPPAYLLQDMTVSVDVEVARLARVLTMPTEALREGDWVLVARDGHARKQAVKVGARGSGRVEVAQGLAEGDLVLPSTAANVGDGKPIRAKARASAPRRT
jgi:HlyD family secretion protein